MRKSPSVNLDIKTKIFDYYNVIFLVNFNHTMYFKYFLSFLKMAMMFLNLVESKVFHEKSKEKKNLSCLIEKETIIVYIYKSLPKRGGKKSINQY